MTPPFDATELSLVSQALSAQARQLMSEGQYATAAALWQLAAKTAGAIGHPMQLRNAVYFRQFAEQCLAKASRATGATKGV